MNLNGVLLVNDSIPILQSNKLAAKRVLKEKRALSYIPPKYENRIEFLSKKGLYDLKLLAPIIVNERSILGFSNKNAKRYCMFL